MIIKIKNISGVVKPLMTHSFQIDEILDISDREWYEDVVIAAITSGDFRIHNHNGEILSIKDQLDWLRGYDNKGVVQKSLINDSGRMKMDMGYELHKLSHQKNGSDEINVNNLSGVLIDQQHIIPIEAVAAMGPKGNNNPLHHERFQQSEIVALPETQLQLNHATHSNQNDPTLAQKQALDASLNASLANPFITKSNADSEYSSASHGHATLPSINEKAALNGNNPSALNKYATMSDIENIDNSRIVRKYSMLPSSPLIGEIYKTLQDETISDILYESGWYEYLESGWLFYSTMEQHTHNWGHIDKAGSKASDISDIPSYPNNGFENILTEKNNSLLWTPKSGSSSSRFFEWQVHQQSTSAMNNGGFFRAFPTTSMCGSDSGWRGNNIYPTIIPFNMIVKGIVLRLYNAAFDWRSSAGNLFFQIQLLNITHNGTEEIGKLNFNLGGSYSGNNTGNGALSFTSEDFEISSGVSTLTAGLLIGVKFRKDANQEGQIYTIGNPHLTIVGEKI